MHPWAFRPPYLHLAKYTVGGTIQFGTRIILGVVDDHIQIQWNQLSNQLRCWGLAPRTWNKARSTPSSLGVRCASFISSTWRLTSLCAKSVLLTKCILASKVMMCPLQFNTSYRRPIRGSCAAKRMGSLWSLCPRQGFEIMLLLNQWCHMINPPCQIHRVIQQYNAWR